MTTVRHETVHYTVEEMAAKVAAEKAAKAKKRKTTLTIVGIIAAVVIFGCSSCLLAPRLLPRGSATSTPRGTVTPTEGYVPKMVTTEANATNKAAIIQPTLPIVTSTPEPEVIPTPIATLIPTPTCLTPGEIGLYRDGLTDLQRAQYDQDILGEIIQFKGQVEEVAENGTVLLQDNSPGVDFIRLKNIPLDVAMSLEKGQYLEGAGTITDVSDVFFGLLVRIEIQVMSWSN